MIHCDTGTTYQDYAVVCFKHECHKSEDGSIEFCDNSPVPCGHRQESVISYDCRNEDGSKFEWPPKK